MIFFLLPMTLDIFMMDGLEISKQQGSNHQRSHGGWQTVIYQIMVVDFAELAIMKFDPFFTVLPN